MISQAEIVRLFTPSLGLVLLVVSVVINIALAIFVYFANPKSATNKIFSFLNLFIVLWLLTYAVYIPEFSQLTLLLVRLAIFFAAPQSLLFFLLAHTLPHENLQLSKKTFYTLLVVTAVVMILNISPYAFTGVEITKESVSPKPGVGFMPFAIMATIYSGLAIYFLIRKLRTSERSEKQRSLLVLLGILLMLFFIISTILIPILFWGSGLFLPLMPVYVLIFLGITAYAIVKHQLFNLKIIATEALTVILWILLFSKTITSRDLPEIITNSVVFIAAVVFGILLVQSVRREVRQREELQKLTEELRAVNAKLEELNRFKTQLLSLASHQIKSPLAAIKGFASILIDGLYGPIGDKPKEALGKIKVATDNLISLINTLLDLRRVEEGKMSYQFERVGFRKLTSEVVSELEPLAINKGLKLDFAPQGIEVFISADAQKLKQVIQNLIDNAIKYTPNGFVKVELRKEEDKAILVVSDSGLGIPSELLPQLFEEFVRDERVKKEIRGTGLGLYIARKIVEAHGGRIWAESEGEGKGSRFYLSLRMIN